MDTNSQFVTKKDLYSVAVNVCWLIFLTGLLSDEGDLFRLLPVLWALLLAGYYTSKFHAAKNKA